MKRMLILFILISKIIIAHDWDGSLYQQNCNPQERVAIRQVNKIDFNGNEIILDAGCGSGKITNFLSTKVKNGSVIGIDSSADMIIYATKEYKSPNTEFFHCGIEELSLVNQFDYIFCFSTYHWVKDQQQGFNNFANSLKPGGTLVLSMADDIVFNDELYKAFFIVAKRKKWQGKINKFVNLHAQNQKQIIKIAQQAGLVVKKIATFKELVRMPEEKIIEWFKAWIVGWPSLQKLSEQELHEYTVEVIQEYKKYMPLENGYINWWWPNIQIIAQKPKKAELVKILDIDLSIRCQMAFKSTDNSFNKKIYPPCAQAYLEKNSADALARVQKELQEHNLCLVILDAYRPLYYQKLFYSLNPDPQYVSDPKTGGLHTRGTAVDVSLLTKDGNKIPMPPVEHSPRAWRNYMDLSAEQIENRTLLETVMTKHGFTGLPTEWWHYDYNDYQIFEPLDYSFEELDEKAV